ncbi:ATP-dependent nuclease [Paenisporosarcina indica]|uniref:ATP-dependent nuclease n=1 Tax=Paenisporosarcina indica TaxID=650093 RepID=UPI00094F9DAC|nr:AAA family ATPase [Paenisporosarcina indica]
MKLIKFSVQNYKIFKNNFSINFRTDSIAILTGRNNTGKSTFLEAINSFFMNENKAKTIPRNCFYNQEREIELIATFEREIEGEEGSKQIEEISIKKVYSIETAPKYYFKDKVMTNKSLNHEIISWIHSNPPYYITPYMTIEDVNKQVQNIYQNAMENDLLKIVKGSLEDGDALTNQYRELINSLPEFIKRLKEDTDKSLSLINEKASNNLKKLFSNPDLSIEVVGAESTNFTYKDMLKYTDSNVFVHYKERSMHLQDQGTGLQRMSLIFLIQNMIQANLLGNIENKLLLIDEPEAFLHPEAIRGLSDALYKIGEEMPLIISTHSPILINLSETHTSLQIFRIHSNEAIELYTSDKEKFDSDDFKNMKILNYVDSFVNEFFFADNIIIVEGDTEYIALKTLMKNNNISNYHIIRARGKDTIVTLMKILNQFKSDYSVIHDIDNDKDTVQKLKTQLTKCKNIYKQKCTSLDSKNITIIASLSNFENALGLDNISNGQKTKNIYNIVTEQEPEHRHAKLYLENLFENINNSNAVFLGNFKIIDSEEDYDSLFKNSFENLSVTK